MAAAALTRILTDLTAEKRSHHAGTQDEDDRRAQAGPRRRTGARPGRPGLPGGVGGPQAEAGPEAHAGFGEEAAREHRAAAARRIAHQEGGAGPGAPGPHGGAR